MNSNTIMNLLSFGRYLSLRKFVPFVCKGNIRLFHEVGDFFPEHLNGTAAGTIYVRQNVGNLVAKPILCFLNCLTVSNNRTWIYTVQTD